MGVELLEHMKMVIGFLKIALLLGFLHRVSSAVVLTIQAQI